MHMTKVAAILAFAVSLAAAAPGAKIAALEKRQSTEFGPYPEDSYEGKKKRQSTEFGPYPEDNYEGKKKRQSTEFGPYPEDNYEGNDKTDFAASRHLHGF
ncbi:hypothetical protein C8034_v002060 [Colletotrichum sidae]|uniref:Uncharacterized protein n=1 Tax=Colletotrichum sidae TaxID=1347389 RepID=A0A4R8TBJ5_9PEZI|nr:hypothetical protein C8034_v002060 [Colletotrichum sidae]